MHVAEVEADAVEVAVGGEADIGAWRVAVRLSLNLLEGGEARRGEDAVGRPAVAVVPARIEEGVAVFVAEAVANFGGGNARSLVFSVVFKFFVYVDEEARVVETVFGDHIDVARDGARAVNKGVWTEANLETFDVAEEA